MWITKDIGGSWWKSSRVAIPMRWRENYGLVRVLCDLSWWDGNFDSRISMRICSGQGDNGVSLHVVWVEARLDTTPRAFDGIRVFQKATVWWYVYVRVDITVCRPAATDDIRSGFDTCTISVHRQRFCPELERETFFQVHTLLSQIPTALRQDSAVLMKLAPNELVLVDFDSLVNTLRTGSFKLFKRPFPGFLTILTL
jgi:hypothetical protein